jgi:hypothetical protein
MYDILLVLVSIIILVILYNSIHAIRCRNNINKKVAEYLVNHSKFITLDEVKNGDQTLFLAYNYLNGEYITQGTSENGIKDELLILWPDCDVYVVKLNETEVPKNS